MLSFFIFFSNPLQYSSYCIARGLLNCSTVTGVKKIWETTAMINYYHYYYQSSIINFRVRCNLIVPNSFSFSANEFGNFPTKISRKRSQMILWKNQVRFILLIAVNFLQSWNLSGLGTPLIKILVSKHETRRTFLHAI